MRETFLLGICIVETGIAAIWTATKPSYISRLGEISVTPPSSSMPVVECPGCKQPMTLRVIEPSPIAGLSTGHFRCLLCRTETAREFKVEE